MSDVNNPVPNTAVPFNGQATVVSPAQIAPSLDGLLTFPGEAPPAPVVTPPSVLTPGVPNVSQAKSDADKALAGIEMPNFEDPEPAPEDPAGETELDSSEVTSDEDADLPDTPAAENFKKLRGVVKETKTKLKTTEEELTTTKNKLERYEKGEVVPDIIRAKDERIAHLEPFEKIVNLKMSKEYQTYFVEPAVQLKEELETIGRDYGIPEHIMHQAVEITNRKDLNNFLSRHFDDVGGLEVKRIIGDLQDLGEKAIEAEKQPQEVLQNLRSQYAEREQEEIVQRKSVFESTAKDAWNAALEKTKKEGVYKELILHPTNTEFNKKVVEPIQYRASVQFGALVKKLADNGLKTLPPDIAAGLARMVMLSIGGAMALDSKVKAEKDAQAIMENTRRTNGFARPSIGSQNGGTSAGRGPATTGPTNPKEAAAQVKIIGT